MAERNCLHCGKPIPPEKKPTAKFCCKEHQKRFNSRKRYNTNRPLYNTTLGQPEVVRGVDLAEILQEWKATYERKYEAELATYHSNNVPMMGPMPWLAQETGLNQRRVYGLVNGEFQYVSLTQADLVLTTIHKHYLLMNGTLHVIPNPKWSQEDWLYYMEQRGICS